MDVIYPSCFDSAVRRQSSDIWYICSVACFPRIIRVQRCRFWWAVCKWTTKVSSQWNHCYQLYSGTTVYYLSMSRKSNYVKWIICSYAITRFNNWVVCTALGEIFRWIVSHMCDLNNYVIKVLPQYTCMYKHIFVAPPLKTFGTGGILFLSVSVCVWVSLWMYLWVCVSQKPCEHHLSKTNQGNFTNFWSLNVLRFIDMLIIFWGEMVKVQDHSRQWPEKSGE